MPIRKEPIDLMSQTPIRKGEPFSPERCQSIISDFRRDGYVLIPGVLESEEMEALRNKTDEFFENPALVESGHKGRNDFIMWHINELDRIFCDMLIRDPIYSLMETFFGNGFQQCGNQVLRTHRGQALSNWHVDNALWLPLPEEIPRFDARIEIPVFWLTVQIALTDIETIEHGPSQYVPGSHYSGRNPPPEIEAPEFEGRGPVSIFCKAGDIYLHNPQCWHRGTPNESDRVRYLLQQQYGSPWTFRRYNAYIDHKMPDHLMAGANERLSKVIGSFRINPHEYYS
jgi:ectoine hydroxylase-related dioxygenase (phytanoyl-CoA dioxygenase family)